MAPSAAAAPDLFRQGIAGLSGVAGGQGRAVLDTLRLASSGMDSFEKALFARELNAYANAHADQVADAVTNARLITAIFLGAGVAIHAAPAALACMQNPLCLTEATVALGEAAAGDALGGASLVPAISVASGMLVLRKGDEVLAVINQTTGKPIYRFTGEAGDLSAAERAVLEALDLPKAGSNGGVSLATRQWDNWQPPAGYTRNADGTVTHNGSGQLYTPVRDASGNVRFDSRGNPVFNTQSAGSTAQTTLTQPSTSGPVINAPATNRTPESYFGQQRRFWTDDPVQFNGNRVYQRNDQFDPRQVSTWRENGQLVQGTNLERMASGRAPIGNDGRPINLHHMTQTQGGAIAEVTQTFHQKNFGTIHINTGSLPSGINRAEFDAWRADYWRNRAGTWGQ